MAIRSAYISSLLLLVASFVASTTAFATLPSSRVIILSPSIAVQPLRSIQRYAPAQSIATAPPSSCLYLANNDDSIEDSTLSPTSNTIYTPLDRPLLAVVDSISLVIFAAIGKSSHSADGSLDLIGILITAFPFITAWLATSPLTGVYSPDDREQNILSSTALKVGKGWIVAVPLGIALRGVIKGYVPPVPFIIVTLIATLVILAGVRILFSVAEDFFVELVN